jgi:hypothetical protein
MRSLRSFAATMIAVLRCQFFWLIGFRGKGPGDAQRKRRPKIKIKSFILNDLITLRALALLCVKGA